MASFLADAVTAVQNEQIKAAVEVVKSLQLANLALSAASIGVSVAGTGALLHKLSDVERKVDELQPLLEVLSRNIRDLRQERIEEDFTRLSTLLAQLEECWSLSQPEMEWRAIAREAHFLAENFKRRLQETKKEGADPLAVMPFLDAFGLASMVRVTSRMACDDTGAALEAAKASASDLIAMGREIQLAPLVLARVRQSTDAMGTPAWTKAIEETETELQAPIGVLRQQEAAAASRALTIEHLRSLNVSGRQWLEAARVEERFPVVYFPFDDSDF
ncbi:hypothetical protein [Blastomonas marina]|nr:hypothetical protein [Blastomonas marina]